MVISVVELTRNCVSGSNFGKVWIPVPVISAPVQASKNIQQSFKKCTKSCLFNVRSRIGFHKGDLTFDFFTFTPFYAGSVSESKSGFGTGIGSESKSGSGTGMHSGYGAANAKSPSHREKLCKEEHHAGPVLHIHPTNSFLEEF